MASRNPSENIALLQSLSPEEALAFVHIRSTREQADILRSLPVALKQNFVAKLPLDDLADLIQLTGEHLGQWLDLPERNELAMLLAYEPDEAGGLMNPRFARVGPDASAGEALEYVRSQARDKVESIYRVYVLEPDGMLLGVLSLREILRAPAEMPVGQIMTTRLLRASDHTHQSVISRIFVENNLIALPVVDAAGRMLGSITVDDVADVDRELTTRSLYKLGGSPAIAPPYLGVLCSCLSLSRAVETPVRKRRRW